MSNPTLNAKYLVRNTKIKEYVDKHKTRVFHVIIDELDTGINNNTTVPYNHIVDLTGALAINFMKYDLIYDKNGVMALFLNDYDEEDTSVSVCTIEAPSSSGGVQDVELGADGEIITPINGTVTIPFANHEVLSIRDKIKGKLLAGLSTAGIIKPESNTIAIHDGKLEVKPQYMKGVELSSPNEVELYPNQPDGILKLPNSSIHQNRDTTLREMYSSVSINQSYLDFNEILELFEDLPVTEDMEGELFIQHSVFWVRCSVSVEDGVKNIEFSAINRPIYDSINGWAGGFNTYQYIFDDSTHILLLQAMLFVDFEFRGDLNNSVFKELILDRFTYHNIPSYQINGIVNPLSNSVNVDDGVLEVNLDALVSSTGSVITQGGVLEVNLDRLVWPDGSVINQFGVLEVNLDALVSSNGSVINQGGRLEVNLDRLVSSNGSVINQFGRLQVNLDALVSSNGSVINQGGRLQVNLDALLNPDGSVIKQGGRLEVRYPLPDPAFGQPGDTVVVNSSGTGYELRGG